MSRFHFLAAIALAGTSLNCSAGALFSHHDVVQFDSYFADQHPSADVRAAWDAANPGGSGLDVFRVFATFDEPAELLAAFGQPFQPTYIRNLTSGTFWNYTEGGGAIHFDSAPSSAQFNDVQTAAQAFDTFAALGLAEDDFEIQFSTDFQDDANHFQTDWSTDNMLGGVGAWFVAGFPPQIEASQHVDGVPYDGLYRVLIFQITVAEGEIFEGEINVGSGGVIPERPDYYFTNAIPVPACMSLFALTGMISGRTRRRSEPI